jgi:hypothetical protein
LFVISGPSGSGKTTLAARILDLPRFSKKLARSISFTTRAPRPGEKNNRDYVFISREEFMAKRRSKKILEWTRCLGFYFGTAVETSNVYCAAEKAGDVHRCPRRHAREKAYAGGGCDGFRQASFDAGIAPADLRACGHSAGTDLRSACAGERGNGVRFPVRLRCVE